MFDDEAMILGGMGIGDDFRHENVDFIVEIEGRDAVARFVERDDGRAGFDASRRLDYLLHSFRGEDPADAESQPLVEHRLAMIAGARERLTIAMAYMGDPRITDALCDAVTRGVSLTLLTSQRANIIADLNLRTCDDLLRRTGAPPHLRIVLSPRIGPRQGHRRRRRARRPGLGQLHDAVATAPSKRSTSTARTARLALDVEEAIEAAIREGRTTASRVPYRPSSCWSSGQSPATSRGAAKRPRPRRRAEEAVSAGCYALSSLSRFAFSQAWARW